jgi:hypothetical protein
MRMRVVLPTFWDDEGVGRLSWDARLALIAMWSYVQDNGVGKDSVGPIIGQLFGNDAEKDYETTRLRINGALEELCAAGLLIRFEREGVKYLEVANWSAWQRPDRPSRARFPTSASVSGNIRETVARVSRDSREALAKQPRSEWESESEPEEKGEGGRHPRDTRECLPLLPESSDAEPRPQCLRHPEGNASEPCGACAAGRRWEEQQAQAEKDRQLQKLANAKKLREKCTICDGTNWIPDTDPAERCDHRNGQPVAETVTRR